MVNYMYLFNTLSSGIIALEITTHPQNRTIRNGESVTFTCSATGAPPISYQWFYNGDEITSANTTTYTFTALYGSFGSYHCTATSGSVVVTSDSATLTGMSFITYIYNYFILIAIV